MTQLILSSKANLQPHIRYIAEAILMSTHNIGFYEDLTKIIFELSSNMHLISSVVVGI